MQGGMRLTGIGIGCDLIGWKTFSGSEVRISQS